MYIKGKQEKRRKVKDSPKEFWRLLSNNNETQDVTANMQDLVEHFKEINADFHWDEKLENPPDEGLNLDTERLNASFTEAEVRRAIKTLKNGKAAGEDLVTNEFVKCT